MHLLNKSQAGFHTRCFSLVHQPLELQLYVVFSEWDLDNDMDTHLCLLCFKLVSLYPVPHGGIGVELDVLHELCVTSQESRVLGVHQQPLSIPSLCLHNHSIPVLHMSLNAEP